MILCILFTGSELLQRLKERWQYVVGMGGRRHLRKRNKWNLNVYVGSEMGRKEPRKWFSFIFLLIKACIWGDEVHPSRQKAKGSVITRYQSTVDRLSRLPLSYNGEIHLLKTHLYLLDRWSFVSSNSGINFIRSHILPVFVSLYTNIVK